MKRPSIFIYQFHRRRSIRLQSSDLYDHLLEAFHAFA